jgi:uncharacterized protein
VRTSSYIVFVPIPEKGRVLLFHGYSGAVDLVSSRLADALMNGIPSGRSIRTSISRDTRSHLATRGYLTEKTPEDEEAYVVELGLRVHGVLRKHASPGFLIIPTYSCNLRCTYCYEKGLHEKGPSWIDRRLTEDMTEAALKAMATLDGPTRRQRCMTLYGGEPLQRSNRDTIHYLHERACATGFRQFSAITNAVDLDHYQDILGKDKGISFLQITIDGPPSVHNGRRFLLDGRGTFDHIVRNIDVALKQGVRISVRVNVDRRNVGHVDWLSHFFQHKQWSQSSLFRAYCSPVHGGICGKGDKDSFGSHLEMRQAIRSRDSTLGKEGEPDFFQTDAITYAVERRILAHLSHKQDLPFWRTAFCGSNMAMYLFDPFGDIYPCWEVIGHSKHRIGVYGPGFLELDTDALHKWHHRSVVKIRSCRSCAYLFFCGGGCEAFAYKATGKLNRPNCSEFPWHFQKAALRAYRTWNTLQNGSTSLSGD